MLQIKKANKNNNQKEVKMTFGQYDPSKTATNKRRNRFYLQNGSNLYRILPPVHSLSNENKIAQYWSIIWLTAPNGRKYPVPSILKKGKNGEILTRDPLIEKIEAIAEMGKQALAIGDTAALQQVKELQSKIYNKKFYALNAMNMNGEVGVLHLPYTAYQSLQNKLKDLFSNGIDPIGIGPDKGLFFDFKRSQDERGRIMYSVEVATRLQKSGSMPQLEYIRAPITDEEAKLIASQAEDLATLYRPVRAQDMELLASLTQEAFDAVFGRGETVNTEGSDDEDLSDVVLPTSNSSTSSSGAKATSASVNSTVKTSGGSLSTEELARLVFNS